MKKAINVLAVLGLVSGLAGGAHAQLVQNGGFELTNYSGYGQLGYYPNGSTNPRYEAGGWTVGDPYHAQSYAYVFGGNNSDSVGSNGQNGNLKLWGPANGSANGLTASPLGGNFLGADGGYQIGSISQVINGLTVGQSYTLQFYWGAAQQYGFTGGTKSGWLVDFGADHVDTGELNIASEGFSGWQLATYTFTAQNTSQTLAFTPEGEPAGVPPFSLLDGVSLTATVTPEGSTMGLLSVGLLSMGGIGAFVRRRSAKSDKDAA